MSKKIAEEEIVKTEEPSEPSEPAEEENESSEQDSTEPEDEEQGDEQDGEEKVLTAQIPILYLSRQYKPGEELPVANADMVQAWLEAGSAAWVTVSQKPPKAKPETAEPGLPGVATVSETGEDLVGKVPRTSTRKR